MAFWAGIDEAGYGPLLGPLVVAGTAFKMPDQPEEGQLWDLLSDAVSRTRSTADGRVVVNDSKEVYTPSRGIRALEEGVLAFLAQRGPLPTNMADLLDSVLPQNISPTDGMPWTENVGQIGLPLLTNPSAVASKADVLEKTLCRSGVKFLGARAVVVLPPEYNEVVARTRNKSQLLWQKCGLILQRVWRRCKGADSFVLIDRHGGRTHYLKQIRDAFPDCDVKVQKEEKEASVYTLSDRGQRMWVGFKQGGDQLALPAALGSMLAKYIREIYMRAFNEYWAGRDETLKPTAGYARDAKRFLEDIAHMIDQDNLDTSLLVRGR